MKSLLVWAFLLLPGLAGAQEQPGVLTQAEEALMDRQYDQAIALLRPVAEQAGEEQDKALFLLGNALYLKEQYAEALAAYRRLTEQFPQSPWASKALFKQADCYRQQRQFDQAGAILEPQLLHLVSDRRREEVATAYLEYADRYFQPPDPEKKPDFARARSLYEKALDIGLTAEKTEQVRFRIAQCTFSLEDFGNAAAALEQFRKDFPKGPHVGEATYLLGVAYLRAGDSRRARRVLQDFLREGTADQGLRGDASLALCQTYHVPQPQNDKELELGVKALRDFVAAFPDHKQAAQADFWIGQSYFNRHRLEEAIREFKRFIEAHRDQNIPELPQAMNLLGTCYLHQKRYREAIATWEQFLRTHVTHSSWNEVQRQVIDAEYLIGTEAYAAKRYDEAREVWTVFQERHPLDVRNPDIMFLLGMIEYEQEHWDAAIAQWEKLTSKYPDTEAAARGWFMIAQTYETRLDRLTDAMKVYEKVQQGPWQQEAQQRLARLRQPELVVFTERTFTTADKPVLKVLTRNLEQVEFRGYKVDLEDYFRKLHTITGIENLDLALIEPDRRWSLKIAPYRPFKEFENPVELPFQEPGVYAVTCSASLPAPAGGGPQPEGAGGGGENPTFQATAVVMISDLSIITKTTRRDALVFAVNARTQEPFPNVQVLVSNGQDLLATGTTGPDGVWQAEVGALKDVGDVRILAFRGGHYASTLNALGGVHYATGLTPRGYLYTDRPVYRPGQTVQVRGIIRKVEQGRYVFQAGDPFEVQLLDPSGAVLQTEKVQLNEYGTFSQAFTLLPEAPLGRYSILVRQGDLTFQGAFDVQEYRLERIRLTLELDRPTVLRGEELSGTIQAAYYYGEPLAGRKVRWGWNDEIGEVQETDTAGKIRFTLPTRDFEEDQAVRLWARLEEEGVQAQAMAYVATVGLTAQLKTLRNVYLAGERFDVMVTAKDLAGQPAASEFTLRALRLETDAQGQVGEVQVSEQPVATDAAQGRATASVQLDKSGRYVLRLSGADAHGNPLSVDAYVQIVGDDDTVKLRLLSDQDTFKVGETAPLKLVFRPTGQGEGEKAELPPAPRLALLTYEGERLYGYQIARIQGGVNEIGVPLTPVLAPSFVLAASVMDGNLFHTATKVLQVERELRLTVTPEKPQYQPGDTVRLTLQSTDQNGQPVSAELSLAAVDEALFAIHGELAPDIADFFYARDLAERTVATCSSCTFHYTAQAQQQVLLVQALDRATPLRMAGSVPLLGDLPVLGQLLFRNRAADPANRAYFEALQQWGIPESAAAEDADAWFMSQVMRPMGAGQGMMGAGGRDGYAAGGGYGKAGPPGPMGPMGPAQSAAQVAPSQQLRPEFQEALEAVPAAAPPAPSPVLREFFPETAFWNGHIVTDANGQATVEFKLPDSITEWRLTARGVTVETLAGTETAQVVASKPFLADLKLPPVFQQGDTVFLTAELHNNTDQNLQVRATLRTAVIDVQQEQTETVDVPAHSQRELAFRVEVPAGRSMTLRLDAVTNGEVGDAVHHVVPIRPWGMEYVATAGGTATGDRTLTLELPEQAYAWKELTLTVGPSIQQAILDAASGEGRIIPHAARITPHLVSSTPARAQALLAAVAYLRQIQRGDTPDYRQLVNRLQSQLTLLATTQNEDGGWSWAAQRHGSDVFVSAQAVNVLATARRLGLSVSESALQKGLSYLQNQFQQTEEQDHERKAAILQAQAAAGVADFAPVNRLHRLRTSLDARSLARLMIALADMGRAEMGRELEPLLREKLKQQEKDGVLQAYLEAVDTPTRWGGDAVEVTGLALWALIRCQPAPPPAPDPTLAALAEWLWAQRCGPAWATPQATAAALTALAYYAGLHQPGQDRYALNVRVNDQHVRRLEVTGDTRTVRIEVPPELLTDRTAKVSFALEGRGEFAYNCVLTGFTETVKPVTEHFHIERQYIQSPRIFEGKPVQRGFSVVQQSEPWTNPATEVPAGQFVQVQTTWYAPTAFPVGRYLVLREPLPSGCKVLEGSIQGTFERYELGDAEITFFFRSDDVRYASGSVSYDLYGSLVGAYRVLPPRLWAYYQPAYFASGQPGTLRVLRRDQTSSDPYRLTPDERYFLGRAYFERKDYAQAEGHLAELFKLGNLREEPFRETARMLFYIYLDRFATGRGGQEDAQRVVRFFEILREHAPTLVVPLEQIVQVARAYRAIGEREREVQVYRATAEASFNKESRIGGVLAEEGEFDASVDFMRRLALSYPDLSTTETSLYTLGQLMYHRATQMREQHPDSPTAAQDLIRRALAQIREFLVLYPQNPIADEASFSFASGLLDLERYEEAIAWSQRLPARYPGSSYLDDFDYIQAYAHFLNEQFDPALALCQRLITENYPTRDGRMAPSDYKLLALYIAGQVFHSRNQPDRAIEYYRQVAERFSDAKEAMSYFQAKRLKVPEVTLARGEDPAVLEIIHRNVPEIDVMVYKVDLLKFYQIHRNLQDIAAMNLAGIKPAFFQHVELGGAAYRDEKFQLVLTVPETGAYFVVAKGDGASASGVLLRTNLDLEVQEDPASGRVRVNVVDRKTGQYVPKAEVWVVGSANETFRKGQSDLRGVLVADDIRGTATVVAWKEGQYAFHRGQTVLQPPAAEAKKPAPAAEAGRKAEFKDEALRGVREQNRALQMQRGGEMEGQLKGGGFIGGVQVQQAY